MHGILKKYQTNASRLLSRLNDVRFVGQIVFVIIVLLISWSGVKSIQSNYELQKQISGLRQQNELQKLTNANVELENQYYNTDTYLDLAARQNFGLAAPGEKEIIVPKDVALSYASKLPAPASADRPANKQPTSQRNLQAWVDFFLHRQDV